MAYFKKTVLILILLFIASLSYAVVPRPYDAAPGKGDESSGSAFALSKSISDIWVDSAGVIWIATNAGLGRSDDGGASWTSFSEEQGLSGNNCNAVWAEGDEIWVQIINTTPEYYEGLGINYSSDGGSTWRVIGKAQGLPTEGEYELAWDILKDDDGVVWVCLWNGGLGRSADNGATWELLTPPDRNGNPGEHFYSIAKRDDVIWTAAQVIYIDDDHPENSYSSVGVYKSEDNGANWLYYTADQGLGLGDGYDFFPVVDIQSGPLSENFVWVGSAYPNGPDYGDGRGVYLSRDGGTTWENYTTQNGMAGDTSYAIGNGAGYFYAGSTSNGVSRTSDYGENWIWFRIEQDLYSEANRIDSMFVDGNDNIWAGTGEGLYVSEDNAETWRWIDYERRAGYADAVKLIPFPNPFEPNWSNEMTFRYALQNDAVVTLEIRDFSGRLVRTLVNAEKRGRNDLIDEEWTGARQDGNMAANGIYFGILKVNGEIAATTKFMITR